MKKIDNFKNKVEVILPIDSKLTKVTMELLENKMVHFSFETYVEEDSYDRDN